MGIMALEDMANNASMTVALSWHLQSNHYPPIPLTMVDVCVQAIDLVNISEGYELVELPEGVLFRGSTSAPAYDIVEQHHLDFWITKED